MTTDEWRNRVGKWIEAQRGPRSIRFMAEQAGVSEGLWRQIESGVRPLRHGRTETVNPKPSTRAAVAEALGYRHDAIARLIDGLEPVALKATRGPINQPLEEDAATEELQRSLAQLQAITEDGVPLLIRLADAAGYEVPPRLRAAV